MNLFKRFMKFIKGRNVAPLNEKDQIKSEESYKTVYDTQIHKAEIPDYFDPKLGTFLIIDDDMGIVSILEDDINYFKEKEIIQDNNILIISGSYAAYKYEYLEKYNTNLNIKWAIIDITIGGSIMTAHGNKRYTGVDVYEILIKNNPDAKFIFYTGNNLNPYIKANKKLIDQFKELSNDDIHNHILYKTNKDMDDRRKYLLENLFSKDEM